LALLTTNIKPKDKINTSVFVLCYLLIECDYFCLAPPIRLFCRLCEIFIINGGVIAQGADKFKLFPGTG